MFLTKKLIGEKFGKKSLNFSKIFHHESESLALSHYLSFFKLKPDKTFPKLLSNVIFLYSKMGCKMIVIEGMQ